MQAYIQQIDKINSQLGIVVARVVHGRDTTVGPECAQSISAALSNEFFPVEGAMQTIASTSNSTFIRAIVSKAQEILPASELKTMQSVSANMYMDKSEKLWALRSSESGDILVRTAEMNDMDELVDMIHSVSSTQYILETQFPDVHKTLVNQDAYRAGAEGGDMVSFVSNSSVGVGFVTAQVNDGDTTSYAVLDKDGGVHSISSKQIVARLEGGELECWPDISLSMSANIDTDRLIEYYGQVYRYSPDYLAKIEQIILSHAF